MGGNKDSEGTLPEQEYLGHRDYTGGGKSPPPMVPPVQHVGSMEVPERAARHYCPVYQGGGAEETSVGGRDYEGERGKRLSGLWEAYLYGNIL